MSPTSKTRRYVVVVDFSGVDYLDSSAPACCCCWEKLAAVRKEAELTGVTGR